MKSMLVKGSTAKVTLGKKLCRVDQHGGLRGKNVLKKRSFPKSSGLAAICPKLLWTNERNEVCKSGLRVDH